MLQGAEVAEEGLEPVCNMLFDQPETWKDLNTIFPPKPHNESGEPGPKIGKHMRPPNLALLAETLWFRIYSQTWSVACQQKQASSQATSMSFSSLWQTHWKTVCSLQPKKMQGELQQSHSGMTRADDSCCWLKSKCLRLHQRNCGLLHVSLLPSQCLQQFDVMWLQHMKNMLAQMVLPDWKHKQLNELLWSFRRTTCVLRWNVWSSSQSPGSFCSNGASTCTSLTSHDFWWNVLLSALEPASTSAHYAIFPMISTEQSRPLPA